MSPGGAERFRGRVADYVRGRPGYPPALIHHLRAAVGLEAGWAVADLGAGTGLLSEPFLDAGCSVFAVEPNPEMAGAAVARLGRRRGFTEVLGTAEATGLPPASVELAVAGQAFHWFDPEATARELDRIQRPPVARALIWNRRRLTGAPFLDAYEAFLRRWGTDYAEVAETYEDADALARVLGREPPPPALLENRQVLDRDGLVARVRSCSYMPGWSHPQYGAMLDALHDLFEAHAGEDGTVTLTYDTVVYARRLATAP